MRWLCFVCNVDVFSVVWLCKRAGRHAGADEDEWSSAKRCRREAGKNKTSLSFTRVNEDVRGFKAQLKCALRAKTLCFGVRNATKDLFSFPFHEVGQYWFLATLVPSHPSRAVMFKKDLTVCVSERWAFPLKLAFFIYDSKIIKALDARESVGPFLKSLCLVCV